MGPEGKMVEVQIRTRAMHEVAEKGIAAHWMYKENVSAIDEELANWANWVRDIFENAAEGQVPTQQLMESFKLNLYQDEIYLFTPKGDLKILPTAATPVDYAYEIHSNIGDHCLAAKVNGRIVPLDSQLKSGDQVEIITSKNQTPNPDWDKFVVTHKAKAHVRRWVREEQRKAVEEGKEIWEKKVRKAKLAINDDDLAGFLHRRKIENLAAFFLALRQEKINPDELIAMLQEEQKHPQAVGTEEEKIDGLFNRFITSARGVTPGIVLNGTHDNFMHQYAKCCHPIPGDDVVGYVTTGEGIKIHRRSCRNVELMMRVEPSRIMDVHWPTESSSTFVSGIRIAGDDRKGMLNDVTHAISSYLDTNIRSVSIDAEDSMFEGTFIVDVKDTEHMSRLIEKIRRVQGVKRADRFEE
jgi:(p)ppGpp synthase/HD superfamily hydrolase